MKKPCCEKQPKRCFLSFADSRMASALHRIKTQAQEIGVFDDIQAINETALDDAFTSKWNHILQPSVRGFGYWVWKPYLIWKTLENLPDGSILLYCDAGCHLNPLGRPKLLKYFDLLQHDALGVQAFAASSLKKAMRLERYWTKGDLLDYFRCRDNKSVIDSSQIEATHILCRKCDTSIRFMMKWYRVFEENFSLIDDSPSQSSDLPEFCENRHDQSVFSLMFKLLGGVTLPAGDTLPYIRSNPIWSMRDKWGTGCTDYEKFKLTIKNYAKYGISKLFLQKEPTTKA